MNARVSGLIPIVLLLSLSPLHYKVASASTSQQSVESERLTPKQREELRKIREKAMKTPPAVKRPSGLSRFSEESGRTRIPLDQLAARATQLPCIDPARPRDLDGDGWGDCNSNTEYKLKLLSIKSLNPKKAVGCDQLYFVIDGKRFPSGNQLTEQITLCEGEKHVFGENGTTVARRVLDWRDSWSLNDVNVDLYDADDSLDFVPAVNWDNDDELSDFEVQLEGKSQDQILTYTRSGGRWPARWSYEIKFKVRLNRFSDPTLLDAEGDDDEDGLNEREEYELSQEFGGTSNPFRQDIFVELDEISGQDLDLNAKRMVKSQFYAHGYDLHVIESDSLRRDSCLEKEEIRDLWVDHFDYKKYPGFHYLILADKIYNGTSGVSWYDTLLVATSEIFVGDNPSTTLSLAGTLIHEIGHQLGLTDEIFAGMDQVYSPQYQSSMNYLYQFFLSNYSDEDQDGSGNNDFDDWENISLKTTHRYNYSSYDEGHDSNPDTNACL